MMSQSLLVILIVLCAASSALAQQRVQDDIFTLETRVISATCLNGEREVLRFERGSNVLPAEVILSRQNRTFVYTADGDAVVPGPSDGLIARKQAERLFLGSFRPGALLYAESLDQERAEFTVVATFGEEMSVPEVLDQSLAVHNAFFGRVTLDENGTPQRMKMTAILNLIINDDDDPQHAREITCIEYRKFTSTDVRRR